MKTAIPVTSSKERLLDKAQELVLSKGFTGTTVDDICRAAGVTKGCFFHHFDSKEELGQVLLERFCETGERMHREFFGKDPDPLKRVRHYLDSMEKMVTDPARQKGCLLGAFAQELSDLDPRVRSTCCKGFAEWSEGLGEAIAAAKARHAPKKNFDPQGLADHFVASIEGALILAKARKDMRVVQASIRHFRRYLDALFGG
jgi:TetR/AcrR family transcriptional repressor of nem operon